MGADVFRIQHSENCSPMAVTPDFTELGLIEDELEQPVVGIQYGRKLAAGQFNVVTIGPT